jgi:nucleotide-binding universal stress UspA family protein
VVIAYDGSAHAREAVSATGSILSGARALVVTVWKPILEAIVAVSLGPAPVISDPGDLDERQRRAAEDLARDGVRRAEKAGLDAQPVVVKAKGPIWEAIEDTARQRRAGLISCGHGRGGTRLELLGSVASGLVQHASRPVMVVPSSDAKPARRSPARRST